MGVGGRVNARCSISLVAAQQNRGGLCLVAACQASSHGQQCLVDAPTTVPADGLLRSNASAIAVTVWPIVLSLCPAWLPRPRSCSVTEPSQSLAGAALGLRAPPGCPSSSVPRDSPLPAALPLVFKDAP